MAHEVDDGAARKRTLTVENGEVASDPPVDPLTDAERVAENFRNLAAANREVGNDEAAGAYADAAEHVEDKLL